MRLETRKTSEDPKRGSWLLGDDLVGHKWGWMEVVGHAEEPAENKLNVRGTWWLCRCACGTEKVLPRLYITRQTVKSCGCMRRKKATPTPRVQDKQQAIKKDKKLSKQDQDNLKSLGHYTTCDGCGKTFIRPDQYWKYKKTDGHRRVTYSCSWTCYRRENAKKPKMTLTERARLQSEALR